VVVGAIFRIAKRNGFGISRKKIFVRSIPAGEVPEYLGLAVGARHVRPRRKLRKRTENLAHAVAKYGSWKVPGNRGGSVEASEVLKGLAHHYVYASKRFAKRGRGAGWFRVLPKRVSQKLELARKTCAAEGIPGPGAIKISPKRQPKPDPADYGLGPKHDGGWRGKTSWKTWSDRDPKTQALTVDVGAKGSTRAVLRAFRIIPKGTPISSTTGTSGEPGRALEGDTLNQ